MLLCRRPSLSLRSYLGCGTAGWVKTHANALFYPKRGNSLNNLSLGSFTLLLLCSPSFGSGELSWKLSLNGRIWRAQPTVTICATLFRVHPRALRAELKFVGFFFFFKGWSNVTFDEAQSAPAATGLRMRDIQDGGGGGGPEDICALTVAAF